MKLHLHCEHAWNLSPEEAVQVQERLRQQVVVQALPEGELRRVGGVDVSFDEQRAWGAVVTLDYVTQRPLEYAVAEVPLTFPYIPGLLSFREAPAILAAMARLNALPDVFIVDGQGLAHPRRFGIASHLGVLLDMPTIGCAKSILVGKHRPLGEEVGSMAELVSEGEVLGMALRMKSKVAPVYVSVGHRVDLPSAVRIIMGCGRDYRLPEPIRLAHRLATSAKTQPSAPTLFDHLIL